jgi:hypothetical protein
VRKGHKELSFLGAMINISGDPYNVQDARDIEHQRFPSDAMCNIYDTYDTYTFESVMKV